MLISDVIMADLNGIDAAIRIRALLPANQDSAVFRPGRHGRSAGKGARRRLRVRYPRQARPSAGSAEPVARLTQHGRERWIRTMRCHVRCSRIVCRASMVLISGSSLTGESKTDGKGTSLDPRLDAEGLGPATVVVEGERIAAVHELG